MSATNFVRKLLLLTAVISLSACTTTPSVENPEELQHAALTRWSSCIERYSDMQNTQKINTHEVVRARCEGHQRDVIATFPIYLENQVNSILSQRSNNIAAERFLRSSNLTTWNIQESTQVDTLKLRSSNAQSEDL